LPPSNAATIVRSSTAANPNQSALHPVGIGSLPNSDISYCTNSIFLDPGPLSTYPALEIGLGPFTARRADACCAEQARRGKHEDRRHRQAVIAGGSQGIGCAIALAFVEASAVSICARGARALAAAREEIARHGGIAHAAVCDLSDAVAFPAISGRQRAARPGRYSRQQRLRIRETARLAGPPASWSIGWRQCEPAGGLAVPRKIRRVAIINICLET
jgi:hypothetical protein